MAIQDNNQAKKIAALAQRGTGIGEAATNQIVKEKDAIGGQLQRFEKLRELSVGNLNESIQENFRSTLSFNDRVKFDIGKIADANIRSVEEVMRKQAEEGIKFQTRESKFLQQRILHLTNRLLEADSVEAKAIQGELSNIRASAKGLAETERKGIQELANTSSKGLDNISILKSSFMEALPSMEGMVEGALGGGFVGKFAGNVLRKRKEVKQRKASLSSELDVERGLGAKDAVMSANAERGAFRTEKAQEFEARGDADPQLAAEMATIEHYGKLEDHASNILRVMEGQVSAQIDNEEDEKEEDRRDERIVEALEDIADREDKDHTEGEEKKKGWLSTIMGVVNGLGTMMRFLKNPKAAFRLFRMKLGGLVQGLGKRFTSIFGAKGLLVTKLGSAFSSIGGIISSLGSGVSRVISSLGGFASSLFKSSAGQAVTAGVTKGASSVASTAAKAGKAVAGTKMGKAVATKGGGFFGSIMSGIKSVGSGIGSAASAVGGAVSKGASAIGSGAKSVYSGAKNLAGKAAKIVGDMSPVKWLTSKLSGKAGGKVLSSIAKVPIIAPLIEGLFTAFDISGIANNPEMSEKEKKEAIGQRLGAGLGGALGAIGGGILGTAIPIPGVGTVLGAVAGDFAGRWLGEKLASLVGGENIYDALSFMLPSVKASPEEAMGKADAAAVSKAEAGGADREAGQLPTEAVSATGATVKARTGSSRSMQAADSRARLRAGKALEEKTGVDIGYLKGVQYKMNRSEDGSVSATATFDPENARNAQFVREQMRGNQPSGDGIAAGGRENRAMEGSGGGGSTNINSQPVAVQTQNNTSTNVLAPQRTRNNDSSHAEMRRDRYSPASI